LQQTVEQLAPDLVVISGDLVEHATVKEFEEARAFLDRLSKPQLVVAGNHDLPFYDPIRRYREGLRLYRRFISEDLEPVFRDSEMIVAGINTPRVFPTKGGRINARQVARIQQETCGQPRATVKILVTHHPLDLPAGLRHARLVGRARMAVEAISPCVDLLLAGHIHLSSTGGTAARYVKTGHSVVFSQAGTALSRRNKGEPNSFNLIRIAPGRIEIQHQAWSEDLTAYAARQWEQFHQGASGWTRLDAARQPEQVQL
jgi:3',5'-cyclic AMP phosphodiesterase CpdA